MLKCNFYKNDDILDDYIIKIIPKRLVIYFYIDAKEIIH